MVGTAASNSGERTASRPLVGAMIQSKVRSAVSGGMVRPYAAVPSPLNLVQ